MKSLETRDFAPHTVRTSWEETQGTRVVRVSLVVAFGLHHMRGNSLPHFSITASGYENGKESFGGCCHDIIAARFPELADVIALHLSDMDGAPMHAEANGFYWLAGIVGGMGQTYHAGSGSSAKTPTQCAEIFAKHARVSAADAYRLAGELNNAFKRGGLAEAKARNKAWTDAQRPRWQREANAAIRKYAFGVYGDNCKTPAEMAAIIGSK